MHAIFMRGPTAARFHSEKEGQKPGKEHLLESGKAPRLAPGDGRGPAWSLMYQQVVVMG